MARVRPNGGKRWVTNASNATGTYKDGVNNPRREWETATKTAEESWKSGVAQASQQGRFGKGVAKAGNEKWKSKALKLGVNRYAEGVQSSEVAYTTGIAPFLQTIESVNLPPRYPKGDPRNLERVKVIAQALREKKLKS